MKAAGVVKQTFRDFGEDEGTRLAAALSYFTVFSIPPLLMLIVAILGAVLDPQDVERLLAGQAGAIMGPAGAQLREIVQNAEQPGGRGFASALSIAGLLFGATGAFLQLQGALNRIWEVKPDPEQGGVRRMLLKRVFSLGMLLTMVFLLLVSLILTTLLEAFGDAIGAVLPDPFSGVFLKTLTLGFSFLVVVALFAMMFRYMPDAKVSWKDVRVGAVATAIMFVVGKYALTLYLGRSDPGSAFGAAGSLALLLVWIYYSAIIVFLGAEFTQAWANAHGREIVPEKGAVRVVETTRVAAPATHEHAAPAGNKSAAAKQAKPIDLRPRDAAAARAARDPSLTMPRGPAVSLQDRSKAAKPLPQPPGARGWVAGLAATLLLRWFPRGPRGAHRP